MSNILIKGGKIVNEGRIFDASIVVEDGQIADIPEPAATPRGIYEQEVDATGCFVLPGIIDEHVHFRDPGAIEKADIDSESRAAAYGGVTTYFEMPNTVPQTTTIEALNEKFETARRKSHVNYSFFFGATNSNVKLFSQLDRHRIPGVKLFMGSSTGNMLVDRREALEQVFSACASLQFPVMTHCEDTTIIDRNMTEAKQRYGDDPPVALHPQIRSAEACYNSTRLAVQLAHTFGTHLHVAHVSTARELDFFGKYPNITGEAVIAHLYFSDSDYKELGALIKCNPAIKTAADRDALRSALTDGRIYTVGTDHAPHLLADKRGGASRSASGMPMVQFSLPVMMELVDSGVLTVERVVELMCHHPASLFRVRGRGYIRKGYQADIVLLRPSEAWSVTDRSIMYKCKWSPLMGHSFRWKVLTTICNGHIIYNNGQFDEAYRGEEISFR